MECTCHSKKLSGACCCHLNFQCGLACLPLSRTVKRHPCQCLHLDPDDDPHAELSRWIYHIPTLRAHRRSFQPNVAKYCVFRNLTIALCLQTVSGSGTFLFVVRCGFWRDRKAGCQQLHLVHDHQDDDSRDITQIPLRQRRPALYSLH